MLGFEAERAKFLVGDAAETSERAVQMNRGIKLHPGLGREDFHDAAGLWFRDAGGEAKSARFTVHNIVVIIAADVLDLGDVRANRRGLAEIEGSSCDAFECARGNEGGIDGCVVVGIQKKNVAQHVAGTGKIEVSVIGKVE